MDSAPHIFGQFGNKVYFFTNPSRLWKTDGTVAGTILLKDFVVSGTPPTMLTGASSKLYFAVNDGLVGKELWMTDGTPAGTVLVGHQPGPGELVLEHGWIFHLRVARQPTLLRGR